MRFARSKTSRFFGAKLSGGSGAPRTRYHFAGEQNSIIISCKTPGCGAGEGLPNLLGVNILRAGTAVAGRLVLLAKLAAGEQNLGLVPARARRTIASQAQTKRAAGRICSTRCGGPFSIGIPREIERTVPALSPGAPRWILASGGWKRGQVHFLHSIFHFLSPCGAGECSKIRRRLSAVLIWTCPLFPRQLLEGAERGSLRRLRSPRRRQLPTPRIKRRDRHPLRGTEIGRAPLRTAVTRHTFTPQPRTLRINAPRHHNLLPTASANRPR